MRDITVAASERRDLCDLMDQVGPDAPTLCEGWTTLDLAAHLVIRESRPDAAVGILLPPLARYTAQVQTAVAQRPWPQLVDRVRNGPPWWSLLSLPWLGDKINTMEYFVHHEDVHQIGAAAIAQRHFSEAPDAVAREQPHDPARDQLRGGSFVGQRGGVWWFERG